MPKVCNTLFLRTRLGKRLAARYATRAVAIREAPAWYGYFKVAKIEREC